MSRIAPVDERKVDPETAETLQKYKEMWDGDWNLTRVLANAPALLEAFGGFWAGLRRTSLSDVEREVVALEMAYLNDCHYCKPAHIMASREVGLPDVEIRRVLSGGMMKDARAALVQRATRRIVETKGKLSDEEFRSFQEQGLSPAEMLEIVGEIAHCTLTNFTNRLAQTELDDSLSRVKL